MIEILLGMAAIILAGVGWRVLVGGKQADVIRSHLAKAVYDVFLPALVVHVLWQSPVDMNTLRLPVVSALCVLLSLIVAWLVYGNGRLLKAFLGPKGNPAAIGALLLASGFANVSYLGLPVQSQVFGDWARFVAICFDMLASTPILMTVGILLAAHYGRSADDGRGGFSLLRVPAIWAACIGVLVSFLHLPMPEWLGQTLGLLGAAVVPLMLLSVGMALRWQSGWHRRVPVLFPVLVIQLVWMPLIAWGAGVAVALPEKLMAPAVIEGAMPTMVLGLVICDRFKLDVGLYAEAVTLSTALSLLSLPVWLEILT